MTNREKLVSLIEISESLIEVSLMEISSIDMSRIKNGWR